MRIAGIKAVGVLALTAFFVFGCAGPKATVQQPTAYKSISGYMGTITGNLNNGSTTIWSVPIDSQWKIENGFFYVQDSDFRLQAIIGVSCFQGESGLEASPWAGVRILHYKRLGLDFGFDKKNFSIGPDWLKGSIVFGPSIFFPYFEKRSIYGAKASVLFY